jgi:DNA polymerase I-like protein with 3'-5' exonuclease and polymerase domains
MKIATVDLETYWAVGHSLTKMSPIAYCMHPDTEIISCAFKFGNDPTVVVFGEQAVIDYCAKVDWSQYWVVGHNLSGFDVMILSWRLGVKPKLWGCTLAMARPIHAKDVGLSLAKLVAHYGLGHKDQSALIATKGKNLCDFSDDEIDEMRIYNAADVDQCYGLLLKLIPQTRKEEVKLIDMTIRMLVEPTFESNVTLLADTLTEEGIRKKAMLVEAARKMDAYEVGMDDDEAAAAALTVLSSAAKFAAFLRTIEVDVPTKISPRTGKEIPALAKTDEGFLALREHDDPLVATAAAARLDAKSTILQTRIQAFMDASNAHPEKKVPIPLKYYGADTTGRWSGWGYNPQNLPRVNPYNPRPSDALRRSLIAPPGHKVVVADLSGIELRVNHFLWKVPSSVAMYQAEPEKADLYKDFASRLYDIDYDEVTKVQRQVGKVAHLGLGFGAGYVTFQKVAKLMGGVDITEDESRDIVDKWRDEYYEITKGWRTCHAALGTIMRGAEGNAVDPWGMVVPVPEGLRTPKGLIRYPDLRTEVNEDDNRQEFVYGHGRNKARIYAGKIDENIVQHLARCVIADNALAVQKLTKLNPALMVHDELVYIVPEDEAEMVLDIVQQVMRTPPEWWPELITWSEGDVADTYGDAK